MAQKRINLGTGYDTGDGDKLRDGGGFINDNFDELYARATSWKAGTFNQRTCVIHEDGLYILKQSAGVPYDSVNIAQEIINGDWILVGGDEGYDDTWIQPSINERVRFKGQWVNAAYNKNDWVISGAWMGVAKIDTTEPFPPEPSGTPSWLLPTAPVWEDLTLVGDIYEGLEFYGVQFNIVDGFRIWSNGVASETFRLFAYEVSATGATTFLDFIDLGANLPAGWNVISLDQFGVLVPNQKYRLILETHADTNTTTLSDNWDYVSGEDAPVAGEIGQTITGLHINEISENGTDQGAFLDDLAIGDDILMAEAGDSGRYSAYRITSLLAKVGNVYNYEVILTAQGNEVRDGRELDVDFTQKGVEVSTNYNRIVDQWPIPDTLPDQIQGFVTQDPDVATSPTPGLNNNAYGLDLFYETYVLSQDWFYIGIGEGTTNQGGAGDIEIVDNLTTPDATKALSSNMGVDIQAQINAIPTINLLPYMLIDSYAGTEANKVDTALNAEKLGGELPSNYIPIAGNEVNPMTGMIYGGEVTTDATSGGEERITTKQLGGFLTYQSIETSPGSGTYAYSEGLGEDVLETNEGQNCIALGFSSGKSNVGNWLVALGQYAGQYNTGASVTAIGYRAGQNNTQNFSEFLGYNAGINNTGTGTFIGQFSGENNSGINCVSIGGSLMNNSGSFNIGVGFNTLRNTTGGNNVAIGYLAGFIDNSTPFTFTKTIAIGDRAIAVKDNQVMLGDDTIVSVRTGNPNYVAVDDDDLVPKRQVALSTTTGEMTGATKAVNQVVISDTDYGDGSGAITGTLYFIKP